jgi:2-methylcitrate dehydratase PrpD
MAFKPYACGTMAHPYIDCARKLIHQGLKVEEIVSIRCKTAEGIVHRLWEPLANKQNPPNGYAAKFSVPYAIAVGMLRDDAGLNDYEQEVVMDEAVRSLAAKVSYEIDPHNPYPKQFTGHVLVELKNGQVLEAEQGFFRGGRAAPMSRADLERKFLANCQYGLWSSSKAESALDLLSSLREQSSVNITSLRA